MFLNELCDLLDVPRPDPAGPDDEKNAYVFERAVPFPNPDGSTTVKRIDLYKRDCFVLEAKQGSDRVEGAEPFSLTPHRRIRRGTAVRGTTSWDAAMYEAKGQAELYVRNLPASEHNPPFIIVADVGHSIELFSDFSRQGRTYIPFPDPRTHRLKLRDLAEADIRERLKQVWTEPLALDPSRRTAKVTREVAAKLAELARSLEHSGYAPDLVAHFLMRCLFTFFAEDVGLLPKDCFTAMLSRLREDGRITAFPDMAGSLWATMKTGGFSPILMQSVLRFNGGLFDQATALPLTDEQIGLLIDSGRKQWREVEPTIFGTLLERALDKNERHKLGAHFTPRAYVERLVLPTIVEPLREQWSNVQAAAVTLAKGGQLPEARKHVSDFLDELCNTTILDPACGTANFLYVAMEHMKRLEGEVRDMLHSLGETQTVFEGTGHSVDPHQFLGIEINPRAAAIAELVLWIGYLQWHFRTFGSRMPAEPIIKPFHNIECRDAVLDYDHKEPVLDAECKPVTRWDGQTSKQHPVTGEDVPDEAARTLVFRYTNPRKAAWPKADIVVGNPPFIGNKRMRSALGDGYVEALRKAWREIPETVDFVMFWWHMAAEATRTRLLSRFGFITTNSITQSFNREVIQTATANGLSLAFAIPDHPWVDSLDGAAVRVAMTVGTMSASPGMLLRIKQEQGADEGTASVTFDQVSGRIHPDLKVGADVSSSGRLRANSGISFMGVTLVGQGFVVEPGDSLITQEPAAMRRYLVGNELNRKAKNRHVIDFFGSSMPEAEDKYPASFQRLLVRVKPERDASSRATYRANWWLFGEKRPAMRAATAGLPRYRAICRTAKYLVFQFVDGDIIVESKVVAIAQADAYVLGVLSSRPHVAWAVSTGSRHGVGNDLTYNNSLCFETFPFPSCSSSQQERVREFGERLDAHRKRQLAQYQSLTITDTYNALETLRSGQPFPVNEKQIHEQGLVSVLKQIHDDLDAAVFDAYGWPYDLTDDEILKRLVELNRERCEEEKRGIIRWLRPEYQNPEGAQAASTTQGALPIEPESPETSPAVAGAKRPWPKTLPEQAQSVRAVLAEQPTGLTPEQLARLFLRANTQRVTDMLNTLVSLGQARTLEGDRYVST